MRIRLALSVLGISGLVGCNTAQLTYPPDDIADANLDACYFHCFDAGTDGPLADGGDASLRDGGDAGDAALPVDGGADALSADAMPEASLSDAADAGDALTD